MRTDVTGSGPDVSMTTPEHTLVGIHLALALGMHRRFGWPTIVAAGVASNLPDWDGALMLIDMQRFEHAHRVWGHNVFSILFSSGLFAWTQVRWQWLEKLGSTLARWFPTSGRRPDNHLVRDTEAMDFVEPSAKEHEVAVTEANALAAQSPWIWFAIAVVAQVVHLPCDVVVSGGRGLADWPIQPWWPLSTTPIVYPLISWGDVGPTIVLMSGCLLAARYPPQLQRFSLITLIALVVYLLGRGLVD